MSADASERFSAIQSEIYHHGYDRGYQQGTNDTVDKAIELLKEYPLVKAMGKIKQLKEQKNE